MQPSTLEELHPVENGSEPKTVLIRLEEKNKLIALLRQYKDVFAWSFEDMKGLDLAFYQHQINLHKDAKPIQQR